MQESRVSYFAAQERVPPRYVPLCHAEAALDARLNRLKKRKRRRPLENSRRPPPRSYKAVCSRSSRRRGNGQRLIHTRYGTDGAHGAGVQSIGSLEQKNSAAPARPHLRREVAGHHCDRSTTAAVSTVKAARPRRLHRRTDGKSSSHAVAEPLVSDDGVFDASKFKGGSGPGPHGGAPGRNGFAGEEREGELPHAGPYVRAPVFGRGARVWAEEGGESRWRGAVRDVHLFLR